ncbi:MAG: hypothetical protein HY399_01485 [Elusimicrobia bacterium]|nr:hypothetical protein [Elusimicrobiota bacterium]
MKSLPKTKKKFAIVKGNWEDKWAPVEKLAVCSSFEEARALKSALQVLNSGTILRICSYWEYH